VTYDEIRRSFARQSMMTTLGAEMTELGEGFATVEAPVHDGALQQHGYGHAGLAFSIGDSAAGYAALTTFAGEVMTVEMKINLLRPCAGDRLIARGKVVKTGRRIVVVTATVSAVADGIEKDIALLQGTMIPV